MTTSTHPTATPLDLATNRPRDRFYAGGSRITAFRGVPAGGDHEPEDWVASTTPLFGEDTRGVTRLPDGRRLDDVVQADPEHWLGPEHVAAHGADTGLLVKLLDAGERLPVHVHPDRGFAAEHLGLAHGKTEAWVALEPAVVHLGFARDVGADELAGWVEEQDVRSLLGAMHAVEMSRGDVVVVPAGLPHAIGAGAFVVELQEPTDLSVLLEWDGFAIDGRRDGHLGLGLATALAAVDRRGRARAEVAALTMADGSGEGTLLPGYETFFRAERWRGPGRWEPGYAVVVVVAGEGALVAQDGHGTPLRAGGTLLVPYAAGPLALVAGPGLEVVRCRPPLPHPAPGPT